MEPREVPPIGAQLRLIARPSPNFGRRKDGALPDIVVIHYTAMASAEAACRALSNPEVEVSAHYLIAETGDVICLVDEAERAWHAGAGCWGDVVDVNSRSIGIELANDGVSPFSAALMNALEGLLAGIMARWDIPAERVIAHSDLAPGRKIDPGRRFDWQRLARGGMAVWPAAENSDGTVDAKAFQQVLRDFGYAADVDHDTLLDAFRLRFNPGAQGPLSSGDMHRAMGLRPFCSKLKGLGAAN